MSKTLWITALLTLIVMLVLAAFFPPRESADVASWMQAFGTLLAVWTAIWLQQSAVADRKRQSKLAIRSFANQIVKSIDEIQFAARNEDMQRYRLFRTLLQRVADRRLGYEEQSPDEFVLVSAIQGKAIELLQNFPESPLHYSWTDWDVLAGNLAFDCRKVMQEAGLAPPRKHFSP